MFFGFFRAGEICIPTLNSFDASKHLSWGDVAIDSSAAPQCLKVHLKRSKMDQLDKDVDIFIGKTDCSLCPVMAVMSYMAIKGASDGSLFKLTNGQPLTKPYFT